ncbi:MAG: glycine cleavage system aminomethyltransferase GcvT [Pseudomonadales bacterium]|nr:glycine cleavage system aminomethyltransferase GcvT [Pseudomonadales bacterium]MCP5183387.1 glycine cleavage system aminomethyltransferase GcvT [Pseudomonadales bacterium]
MLHRTPLFDAHVAAGAKMVPFGGWEMPLHYGSQIAEHEAVRGAAGVFDVSHMTIVDIDGDKAAPFLSRLMANDIGRLAETGQALYGALLNDQGGILDDLIVYRTDSGFRAVVNASTRDKVLAWFAANDNGAPRRHRSDLTMLAVQGPDAVAVISELLSWPALTDLAGFRAAVRGDCMVGRTGYTGEDGVEIMLPAAEGVALFARLLAAGVKPAGLAARDTLRLEAGLNLYGQDMSEDNHPYESNMGWTVALKPADRDFIGRPAMESLRATYTRKLTGLVFQGKGVVRHDFTVRTNAGDGTVTSGVFSPTLGYSVALVRVPRAAEGDCEVDIRGKWLPARLVKPSFVRHGKALV